MLDIIYKLSTIIANVFILAGTVIAILQLIKMKENNSLQLKSLLADHERKRKQSTLEFYSEIYPYLSTTMFSKTNISILAIQDIRRALKSKRQYMSIW